MKNIIFIIVLLVLMHLKAVSQVYTKKQEALMDHLTADVEKSTYPNIHSILISKGRNIMYEHYFSGFNKDSLHDSRSSFKSVTSLLIGIAIDKGLIKNVDQKVYTYFPEYKQIFENDERKKKITIKNLLEMESGLDCEEFNDTKNCEDSMTTTKDWVKFSLALLMNNEPGKVWAYTSCNPMIISGIIRNVAHTSIMNFAKHNLFDPMGITNYKWTVDPSGNGMTAGSFYIKPRDMLKIGMLVRDDGVYKGKQIVSAKWIKESTTATIPIPQFSFVKSSKSKVAFPQPTYYSYYWYNELLKTKTLSENIVFASGNGGQYIMIIKSLDLVVVFTQGNYGTWKAKQAFDILAKYIVPSFELTKNLKIISN